MPAAPRRLKVLQVLPSLDNGGVERGTLEIARALVVAGHDSYVLSAGGTLVPRLEREGSRHIAIDLGRKSPLTFLKFLAMRRLLVREKFDILHVRSRLPAWVMWLAWRGMDPATRPKLVSTVHGLYSVNRYSEIMCCGERVIAVSETVLDYIRKNYPRTDLSKVELIHRGVDPEEFPAGYKPPPEWLESWYQQFPNTRNRLLITLPGRITRLKGHHEFIDLVAQLRTEGVPVHGLIVGGEDPKRRAYAHELRMEVVARGLAGDITFTGSRSDIRDVYAISSVVLSLSTQPESFGRTVVEALSIGTPVVGYDHGGVGEILRRLYPGGAVHAGDRHGLRRAVEKLLASPVTVSVDPVFLLETMTSRTLAVYEELRAGAVAAGLPVLSRSDPMP
ncbi:MAG: glycosyltransferase family 4 protein [Pseudomonadota bacterium]